jgi:hypothetical protein
MQGKYSVTNSTPKQFHDKRAHELMLSMFIGLGHSKLVTWS